MLPALQPTSQRPSPSQLQAHTSLAHAVIDIDDDDDDSNFISTLESEVQLQSPWTTRPAPSGSDDAHNHLNIRDMPFYKGTCVAQLQNLMTLLPADMPSATISNPLAHFVYPFPHLDSHEDPYIVIPERLSHVLGEDIPLCDTAQFLACGEHGLDGFLNYVHYCISEYELLVSLFNKFVSKLIFAIILQFVFILLLVFKKLSLASISGRLQSASGQTPVMPLPFPSTHSTKSQQFLQQHRLRAQSNTVTEQCPGYRLAIPIDISPFACYPYAAHLRRSLPWSVELSTDGITLRSSSCKSSVGRSSAEPCSACSSIASHQIIAGILHRFTHGTHENTKLEWLNLNDLHKLVH